MANTDTQAPQSVKFSNKSKDQLLFYRALNKRVNQYFKDNNIEKTANSSMYVKTIFMVLLYFIPYSLILMYGNQSPWLALGLCLIMGVGLAGIGLSVMHDANHGAYSKNKKVNDAIGYILNVVGGAAINWKLQHNVLHHSYTNIEGHDEDIDAPALMRFSPHGKLKSIHKLQHIYAWFFYGLMTFFWVTFKDFFQLYGYHKRGLLKRYSSFAREMLILIVSKVLYYGYILVVPYILLDYSFISLLLGFFVMHFIAGFILAVVFQPAHVMEHLDFPLPDDTGSLENNWAIHQMHTTTNFAPNNRLLSWYVGGLNYQVEHHLFPHVCHVHYRDIAPIVESTAKEFNVPYYSIDSFRTALSSHYTMLRKLGHGEQLNRQDFVSAKV